MLLKIALQIVLVLTTSTLCCRAFTVGKNEKSAILEQFKFIVLPPNHGYKVIVVIRGGGLRSSIMKKFIIKSLIFLAIEV